MFTVETIKKWISEGWDYPIGVLFTYALPFTQYTLKFSILTVHGASSNPVRDDYAGLGPFSEPESRSLSSYLLTLQGNIDLYLSFHSFGHLLLLPFGNTTDPLANYHDAVSYKSFDVKLIHLVLHTRSFAVEIVILVLKLKVKGN